MVDLSPDESVAFTSMALMTGLKVAGPVLLSCLVVGTIVGLLQALTQIQETTLAFVPKLIAAGVALLLTITLSGQALAGLMHRAADLIISS